MKKLTATAVCFFSLLSIPAMGQGVRSLTDSEWKAVPSREQGNRLLLTQQEAAALQETVLLLRATIGELSQSLALANAEAETFKRQASELALRLDTLGLIELDQNPEGLEQKLLTAVREVRVQTRRAEELENALIGLTEAVLALLQSAEEVPPEIRLDMETRLRQTNELLGALPGVEEAPAVEPELTNALVLEVKPEISLLIANVGSRQGVRIGTPFHIQRGSELIGTALVVDVRERISGAIIQNLQNETNPAQAGDRLRVVTRH